MNCKACNKELIGRQKSYCSKNCKSKHYFKEYYKNNKHEYLQRIKGWSLKKKYVELLGGKCSTCGYNKNYAALHFHHTNPLLKTIKLDVNSLNIYKEEVIEKELKNCIILCANCHAEFHWPERKT